MNLSYFRILNRANEIYAEAKMGPDVHFMAPEYRPQIQSDQVKAILEALIETINGED